MLSNKLLILLILLAVSLMTACTSIKDNNAGGANVEDRTGASGSQGEGGEAYEGQTGAYDDSDMGGGSYNGQVDNSAVMPPIDGNSSIQDNPLVRTIYFDYDSTTINAQGQSALNAHAEYLLLHPSNTLIIEGHTDERGTREYNLALGERRGMAIASFLVASGIPQQQLDVRSYGEEYPIVSEHHEAAWQLNRRVELLY